MQHDVLINGSRMLLEKQHVKMSTCVRAHRHSLPSQGVVNIGAQQPCCAESNTYSVTATPGPESSDASASSVSPSIIRKSASARILMPDDGIHDLAHDLALLLLAAPHAHDGAERSGRPSWKADKECNDLIALRIDHLVSKCVDLCSILGTCVETSQEAIPPVKPEEFAHSRTLPIWGFWEFRV